MRSLKVSEKTKTLFKQAMAVILAVTTSLHPSFSMMAAEYPMSNVSTSVSLDEKLILNYGKSKTIKISKQKFPAPVTPIWVSKDRSVADVSTKGKVKGVGRGKTTVTAMIGDDTYTCDVVVDKPELIDRKITLSIGESRRIALQGVVSSDPVWVSSKPSVASVSENGLVTGIQKGSAKMTATVNKKKYSVSVKVLDTPAPEHTHEKERQAGFF